MAGPTADVVIGRREDALFASDMHLDDASPDLTARFVADLDRVVAAARERDDPCGDAGRGGRRPHLFLLGDLFEFWIGDDCPSAVGRDLAARLAALSADGWRVCLMHGNRDFLIGAAYARAAGARLLPDPCVVEIAGERLVLAHGDALCLSDQGYQQWRRLCRSDAWQHEFLARGCDERLAMALALRARSRQQQAQAGTNRATDAPDEAAGDVDEAAVAALLGQFAAQGLIHGHTHRPAVHPVADVADPSTPTSRWRWVLPDWSAAPARGAILGLAERPAGPVPDDGRRVSRPSG